MSIFSDALDIIHSSDIGSDAVFNVLGTTEGTLRVIDKTSGVDLQLIGQATVPTIVPAAVVRRSVLTGAGVTNLATLLNTTIALNGATWKIVNHAYRPQPGGEMEGEVYLILRKA